jgi:hypothetical protein
MSGWDDDQFEENQDPVNDDDLPCEDCGDDPCTCWPQDEDD